MIHTDRRDVSLGNASINLNDQKTMAKLSSFLFCSTPPPPPSPHKLIDCFLATNHLYQNLRLLFRPGIPRNSEDWNKRKTVHILRDWLWRFKTKQTNGPFVWWCHICHKVGKDEDIVEKSLEKYLAYILSVAVWVSWFYYVLFGWRLAEITW